MEVKKIKICFVFDSLNIGGSQKLTLDVVSLINKKLFDITIINLVKPDDEEKSLKEKIPKDVNHQTLNLFSFNFIKRIELLKSHLSNYDIIHSCMETSNVYCSLVNMITFKNQKYISTIHGVDGVYINDYNLKKQLIKVGKKYIFMTTTLLNFTFKYYTRFIAVCKDTKKSFVINRGVSPEKIDVIYHGLNLAELDSRFSGISPLKLRDSLSIDKNKFVIGYVGRLAYAKGLEFLIEKFSEISSRYPSMILLLSGDGELKEYLYELIIKWDLTQKCRLTGMVNNVSDYYKMMDLFVLPSFSESTNLGLLEAMYYENICISSDCGGIPEIIESGKNGFLFETGNFDQMSEKIEYVYNNYSELSYIRKNARETVLKKFDLSKNVIEIEKKLLEV